MGATKLFFHFSDRKYAKSSNGRKDYGNDEYSRKAEKGNYGSGNNGSDSLRDGVAQIINAEKESYALRVGNNSEI